MAVTAVMNTRECQEAIAPANTHGAMFFITEGRHAMSDDLLKAAEINRRKAVAAKREKEKKSQMEYHTRCKAALHIVDDVGRLTS